MPADWQASNQDEPSMGEPTRKVLHRSKIRVGALVHLVDMSTMVSIACTEGLNAAVQHWCDQVGEQISEAAGRGESAVEIHGIGCDGPAQCRCRPGTYDPSKVDVKSLRRGWAKHCAPSVVRVAAGVTQLLEAASHGLVALAQGPLQGAGGPGPKSKKGCLRLKPACSMLESTVSQWYWLCRPLLDTRDSLRPLYGCSWICKDQGTLLGSFDPWVVHEAVRLVSAAQGDCVLREVRRRRTLGRPELLARLNKQVWLPDWLGILSAARFSCMEPDGLASSAAASRLVAMCHQRVPTSVMKRWVHSEAATMWLGAR